MEKTKEYTSPSMAESDRLWFAACSGNVCRKPDTADRDLWCMRYWSSI